MNSASLCSLAGRYDNPIPTRCLAPIGSLKIPALDLDPKVWRFGHYSINIHNHFLPPILLKIAGSVYYIKNRRPLIYFIFLAHYKGFEANKMFLIFNIFSKFTD
jgi:hypothetical protein